MQTCVATRILHHAAQQTASHPSSPFLRAKPNQTKPSQTEPLLFALSASVSSPTFVCTLDRQLISPAAISTCIARCSGRPFSVTHLPATPSACPLGANSIRRPGFPPQSKPPYQNPFTPNHIPTLQGYGPRMTPFRSFLIADHLSRCSVSHDKVVS